MRMRSPQATARTKLIRVGASGFSNPTLVFSNRASGLRFTGDVEWNECCRREFVGTTVVIYSALDVGAPGCEGGALSGAVFSCAGRQSAVPATSAISRSSWAATARREPCAQVRSKPTPR